jgi:hypothetical protein
MSSHCESAIKNFIEHFGVPNDKNMYKFFGTYEQKIRDIRRDIYKSKGLKWNRKNKRWEK